MSRPRASERTLSRSLQCKYVLHLLQGKWSLYKLSRDQKPLRSFNMTWFSTLESSFKSRTSNLENILFYPTLTLKTAAFVTCRALQKWGNARPCSKSRKKVIKCIVKIEKKNLTWAPVIVRKREKPSPFRSSVEYSHKMEMKYSDEGTLVQRQRYPLPSRSLQYWPMNHCVRDTTSRRSVFENIFDNCVVIIGNGEFNHYHFNNCTFNFKEPQ